MQQAGNKTETAFIRASFEQNKLREIKSIETNQILGLILQQASVLAGIKDGVQDIVKNDLKDLVFGKFGGLSLEEIAYAFKLERQLAYPTKSEHYQFFSTEYVAEILGKYTEWKAEKRRANNIDPLPKKKRELTEEEKEILTLTSILQSFEDFKANGKLPIVNKWIYDELWKRGVMVDFVKSLTEQDKDLLRERAKPILKERAESEPDKYKSTYQNFLKNIPSNEGIEISVKKEVTLAYFYEKLIGQNISLADKLTEYQNKNTQNQ